MHRREFLKKTLQLPSALSLGFAVSLLPLKIFAAAQSRLRYKFIHFRIFGGMDSTLALHPHVELNRLPETELWLNCGLHEIQRSVLGTKIDLGPAAAPVAPFAQKMAIVRGIIMGDVDVGHPNAIDHMASGRTQPNSPYGVASLADGGLVRGEFAMTNTSIQRGSLTEFPILTTDTFKLSSNKPALESKSRLHLYQGKGLPAESYLELLQSPKKLATLNQLLKVSEGLKVDEYLGLAGLLSGLAPVVQIDMIDEINNLDTHSMHSAHSGFQLMRWTRIARFLEQLQSAGELANTLVMVTSEFNRSPGRNKSYGKDHCPTDNAIAFFGGPTLGGTVVGERFFEKAKSELIPSRWVGKAFDFDLQRTFQAEPELTPEALKIKVDKGALKPSIAPIRPADIWATVSHALFGESLKSMPADGRVIKGIFQTV